ncbi:MAG: hypothetical protein K9M56_03475 [Victivallales bacterium]|nr:hypothetical protein [Victivallales bacterium]
MKKDRDILGDYIVLPFVKAWNLFFDIQLPENRSYYSGFEDEDITLLCFIPIVGLIIGLIIYLIGWGSYFLAGTLVSTIISPILILILLEFLTHCRDSSNLVNFLSSKFESWRNVQPHDSSDKHNEFMFYYIFAGVFILRVFCIGALVYYHEFEWLVIVYILTFSVEGYMATDCEFSPDREHLIHGGTKASLKIMLVAFILCTLFGIEYFGMTLFAFSISAIIGYNLKHHLLKKNLLNGVNIGIIGKSMEILLLLLGLIYKLRF